MKVQFTAMLGYAIAYSFMALYTTALIISCTRPSCCLNFDTNTFR